MGNSIALADYKDKFVLLVFLRYSGCPLCNLTIHRLTLEYPMLRDSGCEVVAFIQSSPENIKKNIHERHKTSPQYPIIADEKRKYYDMYGVKNSAVAGVKSLLDIPYWLKAAYVHGFPQTEVDGSLLLVPATFLIGPGTQPIVKAEYGSSFYDHRTFTSIYEPLNFK